MAMNEPSRIELIRSALDALPSDHETQRIPWRGKIERLPVIRLQLDAAVLNPRSHRIKSQLESDELAARAIETDPDGLAAQEAIRDLLRATPGFDHLKLNLETEGQREPGIVTRQGRLINGNTRAVALQDLGVNYIEVGVLPTDATIGEIYDLELDLQVAQDFRQEYTFTNELLFVNDLITEQNRNEEVVALQLKWATRTKRASLSTGVDKVKRYVRHLALIREIQELSGHRVPLTYFDDAEQTLQEFDKAYESLRDKDPVAAHRLKQARILGLLVELGYERQRLVDASWVESHLLEALNESEELGPIVNAIAGAEDPGSVVSVGPTLGLEDFEDAELSAAASTDGNYTAHKVVSALVRAVGASAGSEVTTFETRDGAIEIPREGLLASVNEAMRVAAEDARAAAKAGTALKLPVHYAEESAKLLSKARAAYERVVDNADFRAEAMKASTDKVARALDALKSVLRS